MWGKHVDRNKMERCINKVEDEKGKGKKKCSNHSRD